MSGRHAARWRITNVRAVGACLLALACASVTLMGSASAIQGGVVDGNQHPNIGVMVMDTPSQGISLCSGSLVKSSTYGEIFLSASHCGWGGGQGQVVGISFDPNAINWNSTSSSIAGMFNPGVVVHYAKLFWNTAFRQCCFGTSTSAVPAYSDEDISVAVFNTDDMPTGISRLPIAPIGSVDSLALGSTITDVGYGITGPNNNDPGIRRATTSTLEDINSPQEISIGDPNPQGTCEGDSGSPALATIGGVPTAVSVVSWGYANSCNFTDEMRLDNSWVQNYINAFYPGTTALPNGQPTAYVNGVKVTRYFGTPNPSPLYSVSGIPTGTQGGAPAVSTKATKTSVPGVYPVTVSAGSFTMTGSFEAYAINLVNGAITVDRAPITVTVAKPTFLAGLAHLSAVVTNAAPGAKNAPAVGLPVTFSVTTSTGHTYSCKGKSNASGKASCSVLASAITTSGTTSTYTATVPASTDYLAGSGSASFTR